MRELILIMVVTIMFSGCIDTDRSVDIISIEGDMNIIPEFKNTILDKHPEGKPEILPPIVPGTKFYTTRTLAAGTHYFASLHSPDLTSEGTRLVHKDIEFYNQSVVAKRTPYNFTFETTCYNNLTNISYPCEKIILKYNTIYKLVTKNRTITTHTDLGKLSYSKKDKQLSGHKDTVEKRRKELSDKLQEFERISYTNTFTVTEDTEIEMWWIAPTEAEVANGSKKSSGVISYMTGDDSESSSWWNLTHYGFASQIHKNSTGYYGVVVNDTSGVGGTMYHALIDNTSNTYIACTGTGFTGSCAIVNETAERPWFNGTDCSGYSIGDVYEKADIVLTFDNNSGNITSDCSGEGNNGMCLRMLSSGCRWVPGKFGSGMNFSIDATGDNFVNMSGPNKGVNEPFSWEFWLYYRDADSYGGFISKGADGGGPYLFYNCPSYMGRLSAYMTDYIFSDTPIPTNVWTHVVFTFNSTHGAFYFNGNENGSTAATTPATTACYQLGGGWGCRATLTGYSVDAIMDEVRIYNRSLGLTEIQEHYQSGANNRTYLGAEQSSNTAPWVTSVAINSTPDTPDRTSDLNCSCIPLDNETTSITVNFTWWRMNNADWEHVTTYDSLVACTNNTICYTSVLFPNSATELGQDFKCMAMANDSVDTGSWVNSSAKEIRWYININTEFPNKAQYNCSDSTGIGCVIINTSSITLECNQSIINGTGLTNSIGLNNTKSTITLKNCTFSNYYYNMFFTTVSDITFYNINTTDGSVWFDEVTVTGGAAETIKKERFILRTGGGI